MSFEFDRDKTRLVCRACSCNYSDSYFADFPGDCDDCKVNISHSCFTNLPSIVLKESDVQTGEVD